VTTPLRKGLRRTLLALCAVALLAFGSILVTSYVAPITVEQAAREVIRIEVERRVGERMETLSNSRLTGLARKALQTTKADANRAEEELRRQLPQRVANAVAELLKVDCECRKRMVERARQTHEDKLGALRQAEARLSDWIEHAYANTRELLLRELRIFTGIHAALFLLLGLLCLWKRQSTTQLALVAATLLSASALVGGMYLFNQNWLHTLVFGDYVGWGYAGYLLGVSALFTDIAFNKGRLAGKLLGTIGTPPC
jgi:hypothetical protein